MREVLSESEEIKGVDYLLELLSDYMKLSENLKDNVDIDMYIYEGLYSYEFDHIIVNNVIGSRCGDNKIPNHYVKLTNISKYKVCDKNDLIKTEYILKVGGFRNMCKAVLHENNFKFRNKSKKV